MKNLLLAIFGGIFMSACSVVGHSGVETATYNILEQQENIEVREYKDIVLVSAAMGSGMDEDSRAFGQLFDYISGANVSNQDIAMTAPVFMDQKSQGEKIEMTAPVFMDQNESNEQWTMSFVLPESYTFETAPKPTNPNVKLGKIDTALFATIRFNGYLSENNVQNHLKKLEQWISESGYKAIGPYKVAGYNPPFTLPMARRNEVLIPVSLK